jgi:hypothetical protein
MLKGDKYKVYEDPITRKKLEGIVKIIRVENTETYLEFGYHYCAVKFGEGEPIVHRKICEHDLVSSC